MDGQVQFKDIRYTDLRIVIVSHSDHRELSDWLVRQSQPQAEAEISGSLKQIILASSQPVFSTETIC